MQAMESRPRTSACRGQQMSHGAARRAGAGCRRRAYAEVRDRCPTMRSRVFRQASLPVPCGVRR